MSTLVKILIPVLVLLAIVSALYFKFSKKPQPISPVANLPTLEWKAVLVPEKNAPPNYQVDIYLTGERLNEIQAAELNISLESDTLQINSSEPGGFYTNPLTIKMDDQKMIYALARNPSSVESINPDQPILKLLLESASGFDGANLRVLPTSQVYVKSQGGAYPSETVLLVK